MGVEGPAHCQDRAKVNLLCLIRRTVPAPANPIDSRLGGNGALEDELRSEIVAAQHPGNASARCPGEPGRKVPPRLAAPEHDAQLLAQLERDSGEPDAASYLTACAPHCLHPTPATHIH